MGSGLRGIARTPRMDPQLRRNFNRLAQKFEDLVLASPLIIDNEGRFSIDEGDGVTVDSNGKLTLDLGFGVEIASNVLRAKAGALIEVDADGVNGLPTVEWSQGSSGVELRRAENRAARDSTAAQAQAFAWFL